MLKESWVTSNADMLTYVTHHAHTCRVGMLMRMCVKSKNDLLLVYLHRQGFQNNTFWLLFSYFLISFTAKMMKSDWKVVSKVAKKCLLWTTLMMLTYPNLKYLNRTPVTGAGASSIHAIVKRMFGIPFKELTQEQKDDGVGDPGIA